MLHPLNAPSIKLLVKLGSEQRAGNTLLDSGATGNVVNEGWVRKHSIRVEKLRDERPLQCADGSMSAIKSSVRLRMRIGDSQRHHQEDITFYVANISSQYVILGTDWLIRHNPTIDWQNYQVTFERCPLQCNQDGTLCAKSQQQLRYDTSVRENTGLEDYDKPDWGTKGLRVYQLQSKTEEINPLRKVSNVSQQLAQQQQANPTKPLEEAVPSIYHKYLDVFQKDKADRFPTSKPWDHAIKTKPGYVPKDFKIYPLSPTEQSSLDKWIKEQLDKGYIRPSKSPQASPFFFVGKKVSIQPTQDY
jgi:hypothetical protein